MREEMAVATFGFACGIVMIAAVLWAGSAAFTHAPIFAAEAFAVAAFAVSWVTKAASR